MATKKIIITQHNKRIQSKMIRINKTKQQNSLAQTIINDNKTETIFLFAFRQ